MPIGRIYEHARSHGEKTAVVHNGAAFDYAWFATRIEAARAELQARDLAGSDVAVLCFRNFLDTWVYGLALRSIGITTIAIRGVAEMQTLTLRSIGVAVTTEGDSWQGLWEVCEASGWRLVALPPLDRAAVPRFEIPATGELTTHPGGHIMMTSGTTGTYKLVLRDAVTEASAIPLHAEINEISSDSVVYVANFGPWTGGGHRWPLISWSVGATVVIHQAPDLHRPLLAYQPTHAFATPEMVANLLRAPAEELRRNDCMRLLVTGGTLPRALLEAAKERLTRRVFSVLASTEALTLGLTPLDGADDLQWHRIHPSRELQVVDEAGRVLQAGEVGLVRVRIIDGLTGYVDDEAATRRFFHDGYFYPGDLGAFGEDGRLSLHGRASDVVNVLGNKIATGSVEQALQNRLGVTAVCIVSTPSTESGEDVHVIIETQQEIPAAVLREAVRAELGELAAVPLRVHFSSALPRNEMGKVERLELRRQLVLVIVRRHEAQRCGSVSRRGFAHQR